MMAESAFHSTAHASTLHHQRIIKPSVEAVLIRSMETDVFVVRSSDDNRYHAVSQLGSNFSHLQLLSNCISFSSGFMVIIRETVMTSEISCVDAGKLPFHPVSSRFAKTRFAEISVWVSVLANRVSANRD